MALVLLLAFNFLPFGIACSRRHNDTLAIFFSLVVIDIGVVVAFFTLLLFGLGFILGAALVAWWFGALYGA
jgi:hypothetical protein